MELLEGGDEEEWIAAAQAWMGFNRNKHLLPPSSLTDYPVTFVQRALPIFIKALTDRTRPRLRENSIELLVSLGSHAARLAVPALIRIIADEGEDAGLRRAAILAMQSFGVAAASPAIPAIIRSPSIFSSADLLEAACSTLGDLGPYTKDAIKWLVTVLERDGESRLHQAVVRAMTRIDPEGKILFGAIAEDPTRERFLSELAFRIGEEVVAGARPGWLGEKARRFSEKASMLHWKLAAAREERDVTGTKGLRGTSPAQSTENKESTQSLVGAEPDHALMVQERIRNEESKEGVNLSSEKESRSGSTSGSESVIKIDRWADLEIGITEDGSRFLAFFPRPDHGKRVFLEKGVELNLRGKDRWPVVLDLLAKSHDGRTATKFDLAKELSIIGTLKRKKIAH